MSWKTCLRGLTAGIFLLGTTNVDEEEDYTGNLTFGLGADSDIGIFGTVGLALENVLGGKSVSADLTYAEQVAIGRASISSDQFWLGERAGGVRLEYAKYDYDNTLFDFETATIRTGDPRLLQQHAVCGKFHPTHARPLGRCRGLWRR